MKTSLTVTIDEELLLQAKQLARSRGVSLSGLIEEALRNLSAGGSRSFSRRWRGAFRPAARRDGRYRRLARKYLII
jgi:post-segregation antitoxin (ccd killing protein)